MITRKQLSIKTLEDILYDLFCTRQLTLTQYIGRGLYNIGNGTIVNERVLEEIHKRIRESL